MNTSSKVMSKVTVVASDLDSEQHLIDSGIGVYGYVEGIGDKKSVSENVKKDLIFFLKEGLGSGEVTLPFVYRSYLTAIQNLLFNSVVFANNNLVEKNKKLSFQNRSAASLCVGLIQDSRLTICSVGDAAVVFVRNGQATLLNRPKSSLFVKNPELGNNRSGELENAAQSFDFPLVLLGMYSELEPEIFEVNLNSGDVVYFLNSRTASAIKKEVLEVTVDINKICLSEQNQRIISDVGVGGDSKKSLIVTIGYEYK